jgi:hypothetical protein
VDLTDTLYDVTFSLAMRSTRTSCTPRHDSARDAARSVVTAVCDLHAEASACAVVEVGMRAVIRENIVGYRMDASRVMTARGDL